VAFEPDPASPLRPPPPPLAVIMTTAHHFNDFAAATVHVATANPAALRLRNGLGAPIVPVPVVPGAVVLGGAGGVTLNLTVGALPQYLELPQDASATAVCQSLVWPA